MIPGFFGSNVVSVHYDAKFLEYMLKLNSLLRLLYNLACHT